MSWNTPRGPIDPPEMRSRLIPRGRFGLLAIVVLIALVIARGREPHVTVPSLHGLTVKVAVTRLDNVGLKAVYLQSHGSKCDFVVNGEAPTAGSSAARGATVRLLVDCQKAATR
jgi:beta-lactam-binding protein with PASTA domain